MKYVLYAVLIALAVLAFVALALLGIGLAIGTSQAWVIHQPFSTGWHAVFHHKWQAFAWGLLFGGTSGSGVAESNRQAFAALLVQLSFTARINGVLGVILGHRFASTLRSDRVQARSPGIVADYQLKHEIQGVPERPGGVTGGRRGACRRSPTRLRPPPGQAMLRACWPARPGG
jgi:hypothetical protein